ncbi:MAG: hypothetical protein CML99_17290 [Rhodobiaceae bacterium]|nr:hypothetical protein [Rhodobiaceae bacterium]
MELAFKTKALRALCANQTKAQSTIGKAGAAALRHVLADLRAAVTLHDMIEVQFDGTTDSREASVALDDGYVLNLRANHVSIPRNELGETDWSLVQRIKVMGVAQDGR